MEAKGQMLSFTSKCNFSKTVLDLKKQVLLFICYLNLQMFKHLELISQ